MLVPVVYLLSLGTLVAARPQDGNKFNVDDPGASDPTKPPTPIAMPSGRAPNPYPDGMPKLPAECRDPENPSEDCFKAMGAKAEGDVKILGGYIKHDGTCGANDVKKLETAVWDASTLANYARDWPRNIRGINAGEFYIGPDFASQQQRMRGKIVCGVLPNLAR